SERRDDRPYERAEHVVDQGKLLELAKARPAKHRHVARDHALIVDKYDNILVRLAPEPAALFIVLCPVNDPNPGLGGEHFQHRRQLSTVRTLDIGPRALNGGRELKHADVAR